VEAQINIAQRKQKMRMVQSTPRDLIIEYISKRELLDDDSDEKATNFHPWHFEHSLPSMDTASYNDSD